MTRSRIGVAALLLLLVASAAAIVATRGDGGSGADSTTSPPTTVGAPPGPSTGVSGDEATVEDRRGELAALAETTSTAAAVAQMLSWVDEDDRYARACHNDAHMLGAMGARLEGGAAVIGLSTRACDFGFVHGVLKATALDAPSGVDPNELAALCSLAPADVSESCDHGLGHAVPLRDKLSYSESIQMCLRLDGEGRQAQCVNGAMMEFGVNYMYFHDLRSLDPGSLNAQGQLEPLEMTADERRHPCRAIAGVGTGPRDICYRHMHYFWSPELGTDYLEFERRCLELVDDMNRSCFQSLGAWAWYAGELWADESLAEHKATIDASCMTLTTEDGRQWCVHGYAHTIWQSEPDPGSIPSLCEYLGPRYEPGCSSSELRFRPAG